MKTLWTFLIMLALAASPAAAVTAPVAYNQPMTVPVGTTSKYFSPFFVWDWESTYTIEILTWPTHGTLSEFTGGLALYTPTPGYVGTDQITWRVTTHSGTSNAATCTIRVEAANSAPVAFPMKVKVVTGRSSSFQAAFYDPDRVDYHFTSSILIPPSHGTLTVANQYFSYTPTPGYVGTDTFTWKISDDGNHESAPQSCDLLIHAPRDRAGMLVLLVVNEVIMPEISAEVDRLSADLVREGYRTKIITFSQYGGDALWDVLHGECFTPGQFMSGAIFIGNLPRFDTVSHDVRYWNLSFKHNAYKPPYNIWVSRICASDLYIPSYGDEVTLIKRALQANHDYRTGASRLPHVAFHYDNAYGGTGTAALADMVFPRSVELRQGPSVMPNTPSGMRDAFRLGGELLFEETHGGNGAYDLTNMNYGTQIDNTTVFNDIAQLRVVLASSCNSGVPGGVVNCQLVTRGGGNVLSIGQGLSANAGGLVFNDAQLRSSLAAGESWGEAIAKYPFGQMDLLMCYGDLSLGVMADGASNQLPQAAFVADKTSGTAPLTVNFSGSASDSDGSISKSEWFLENYQQGRIEPTFVETMPTQKQHTYTRPHRYRPRLEVVDNFKARAFAEQDIVVAPRSDRPLRVNCGLNNWEYITLAAPSLDYVSPVTGNLWLHDQSTYGTTDGATWGIPYSGVQSGKQTYAGDILGTQDDRLFHYAHLATAAHSYHIPVSNGTYTVNLGFADVWSDGPGQLTVDVYLCGQLMAARVDPYALAGAKGAVTLSYQVTVTNGNLTIQVPFDSASTRKLPDGNGFSAYGWLNNFEVIPTGYVNHAPVAQADSASTPSGQWAMIPVLVNDGDSDGDELFVLSVGQPSHGSAVAGGKVAYYLPSSGFIGTDHFAYQLCDGNGGIVTGNVTVAVGSENVPTYALTVLNGSGSGNYATGTTVAISANPPAAGYMFSQWTGASVASPNSPSTTVTMPGSTLAVTATYQVDPTKLMNDGLLAHWKLDDAIGTAAADVSGNNNTGILLNGPSWTAGTRGGALSFDGVDNSVSVADNPSLRMTGDCTFALWVRKNSEAADWQRLIGKGNPMQRSYGLWEEAGAGKRILFQQYAADGTPIVNLFSNAQLDAGRWYHVACVVSGSAVSLYINGSLNATGIRSGTACTSADPLTLGYAGYHAYFPGLLDEVRVYNKALSSTEIVELATTSTPNMDGSFEMPSIGYGNYVYNPIGGAWTFNSTSGVTGNASGFTSGNPAAPEGGQVAFLQGRGWCSQSVTFTAGTFSISLRAAQRGNWQQTSQQFRVRIDGTVVGTFHPSGTAYETLTTSAFAVTAGSHEVILEALNSYDGDNTVFIDAVELIAMLAAPG
jgi:hypothetical protein